MTGARQSTARDVGSGPESARTSAPALGQRPESPIGGGLLSSALLPPVVHEASAALLVVDLTAGKVTYANDLARALAPDLPLPVPVDRWSASAGLEDVRGVDLPDDGAAPNGGTRSQSLLRVAHGEPVLGEAVTAERATAATDAREPLWVIGLPMTDAPAPVSELALVAFLPLRNANLVAGAQESAAALRDRAVLATRVAFTISDPRLPDNPLVWVNPAFTATTGFTLEEAVGQNCRFLQGPGTDPRLIREIRTSLRLGRPITTTLLNYRKDGTPFWNELSISPVFDADDRLTHFVGVQADVTGRVEAQQARDEALLQAELAAGRLRLLADFAKRLTGLLGGDDIVELLADVVVPTLGTWCAVNVLDEERRLRSVVRHERQARPEVARLMDDLRSELGENLPAGAPTWQLLRGERSHVLLGPDDAADGYRPAHPRGVELAEALELAGALVVPLQARDRVLGSLAIGIDHRRRPFGSDDVALAAELASRAGLMLENSMLYSTQLSASVALQRSLLPRLPSVPGLSIDAEYVTARDRAAVGGDWYDVFTVRDGAVGIAVGDAMGHNFDSAATMGKLSTMLRSYAWPADPPAQVLDAVDELIAGMHHDYLATCVYGLLRLTDGGARFAFSSAGHPPPVLRLPDGSAEALVAGRGPMLGVSRLLPGGVIRQQDERHLERGSTLILFTDGLTDAMGEDGQDLDVDAAVERLAEIVSGMPVSASPSEIVAALAAEGDSGRKDDVAVVAVRID